MSEDQEYKKKRDRSPNYPGLTLDQALGRARRLHGAQGRHGAPTAVAIRNMGLSPKSGTGLVAIAALKKFGLIQERGQGTARVVGLSDLGLRLILPGNPTQADDLRAAALNPPIYRELWEELGPDLPDDMTLGWRLRNRGFTESGITEFIPRFRETTGLLAAPQSANLGVDETLTSEELSPPANSVPLSPPTSMGEPVAQAFRKPTVTAPNAATPELMVIPIPLGTEGSAALQVPTQMSRAAWAVLKKIIDAYEGIVVVPTHAPPQSEEPERTDD